MAMAFTTASSLLVRLRDRADHDAWTRLNALYSHLLHDWCRRYGVPPQDADDLVQEVLQTLVREMPTFEYDRARGSFRGWLRTILVNRLRHHQRSERFKAVGDFDSLVGQLADDRSVLSEQWDREHDQHVVARLLEVVQGDFDPKTWEAFLAVTLGEEDVAVVACRLGLSPNAVHLAKYRVLHRLQREANLLSLLG
jgi:RNA polymerase sigma-70 factor (ECF subfamily)